MPAYHFKVKQKDNIMNKSKTDTTQSIMAAFKESEDKMFELTGCRFKNDTITISKIAKKLDSIMVQDGSLFDAVLSSNPNIRKYILLNIEEIHSILQLATDDEIKVKETAILAVVFRMYCFNFCL